MCGEMHRLHRAQPFDAITRTEEGDEGHSILQKNMPDDEEYDCEPNERRKLRHPPSAWLSCFHLHISWPVAQRKSAWTSWFCQYLGVPSPQLLRSPAGRMQTAQASEMASRHRPSSALAIGMSMTRTVITSTPASSTLGA